MVAERVEHLVVLLARPHRDQAHDAVGGARVEALDVGPRGVVIVVDDGFVGPPGRGGVVVRRALELLEGRLPGRAVVQPRHLRLEVRIVGRERRRGRRRFGAGGRGGRATPAGARGVFSVFFVFFILLLLVVVVVSVFEPGVGAVHARVVEHVRHRHEALAAVRVQLERARRDERRRLAERQVPRGALRVRRFFFFFFFGGFFFVYTLGVPASIEHLRRHSAVREERAQALRVLAADGDDPRVVLAHRRFVLADAAVRVGAGEASLESVLVPRERQRLASAREDGEVWRPRRGGAEGALVHHRQDQRGVVEVVEGSAREDGGDGRVPGGDAPRPRDLAKDVADAHGAVRGEDRAVRAVGAGRGDVARDERGCSAIPRGAHQSRKEARAGSARAGAADPGDAASASASAAAGASSFAFGAARARRAPRSRGAALALRLGGIVGAARGDACTR